MRINSFSIINYMISIDHTVESIGDQGSQGYLFIYSYF